MPWPGRPAGPRCFVGRAGVRLLLTALGKAEPQEGEKPQDRPGGKGRGAEDARALEAGPGHRVVCSGSALPGSLPSQGRDCGGFLAPPPRTARPGTNCRTSLNQEGGSELWPFSSPLAWLTRACPPRGLFPWERMDPVPPCTLGLRVPPGVSHSRAGGSEGSVLRLQGLPAHTVRCWEHGRRGGLMRWPLLDAAQVCGLSLAFWPE